METKLIETVNGIELYQLSDDELIVQVCTYGARIHKILVKDKDGALQDVVAGFPSPDGFIKDDFYLNAVIGRVANRVGDASFTLNGKKYNLCANDGKHHLHGGTNGFFRKIWKAEIVENGVKMTYLSPDGEEGYPGNLRVSVTYSLSCDRLNIEYDAVSDQDTICSLTNHSYFNLDGDFDSVLDQEVYIASDKINLVDNELISHGEFLPVAGTAYDFNTPKKIGRDIKTDDFMMNIARGYDFNYVLNNNKTDPVAWAYSEKTGIKMEVYTDRDCMQFYTGNFLDGLQGRKKYNYQSAFCMETQGYPNACNVPSFPSMTLKKGAPYNARTSYRFYVAD